MMKKNTGAGVLVYDVPSGEPQEQLHGGLEICSQSQPGLWARKAGGDREVSPEGVWSPLLPLIRDPACRAQTTELYVHGRSERRALLVFAQMTRLVPGGFCKHAQVQGSVSSGRKCFFRLLSLGPQGEVSA